MPDSVLLSRAHSGSENPMTKNPYLMPGRLSDVIAAITALGTYRYYKLSFDACAERIANRPDEAEHWGRIFTEHPEFFRVNEEGKTASLVWRRQHPKRFDAKRFVEISREVFEALLNRPGIVGGPNS